MEEVEQLETISRRNLFTVLTTSGCYYIAQWMGIALLPVLASELSNSSTEVIFVIACRTVPRLVLAPLGARLISRFGPRLTALCSFFMSAAIIGHLRQSSTSADVLISSTCLGIVDIVASPALLLLRSSVAAEENMFRINAIFQGLERVAKIGGPALIGAVVLLGGLKPAVTIVSSLFAICAVSCWLIPKENKQYFEGKPSVGNSRNFVRLLSAIMRKPVVRSITLPAVLYGVPFGAMTPFFVWLTEVRIHLPAAEWTLLLTAQGVGALLGAGLMSTGLIGVTTINRSLLLFVISSIVESGIFILFLATHSLSFAATVSFLAGIPEIAAYVTYLSLVQTILTKEEQGLFYAVTMGLFDVAVLTGLLICYFCEIANIAFSVCWLLVCLFGIIPVLPAVYLVILQYRESTSEKRSTS